jgi:hypothetical protein
VARAVALERRRTGDALRPSVALLQARLRHYRGQVSEAREDVARIRATHHEAASSGQLDLVMAPAEEVLCDTIDLATRDATHTEWDALEDRSAGCSVGMEHVEVLEARAISALRGGRAEEAVARLERALEVAERTANAMRARLARGLAEARYAASVGAASGAPRHESAAYTANEIPKPTNQA